MDEQRHLARLKVFITYFVYHSHLQIVEAVETPFPDKFEPKQ
jgi:hypothetical protein